MTQHLVELERLQEFVDGVAAGGHLLVDDLGQLVALIAVVAQVALVVLAHAVHRVLCFGAQLLGTLLGERIAGIRRVALGHALAQQHLHGLLRDIGLQLGVILVQLIAVLRVIADVALKQGIKVLLHLGAQHLHLAVIGAGQHGVPGARVLRVLAQHLCGDERLILGQLSDRLSGRLSDRLSGRLGGRFGRRLGGRLGGRLGSRLSRRLGGRLSRRLGGRLSSRLGGRLSSRLGGRRFGHDRRKRRLDLRCIRPAAAERRQREHEQQGHHGLLLHSLRPPICVSAILGYNQRVSLYAQRGKNAIVSGNCPRRFHPRFTFASQLSDATKSRMRESASFSFSMLVA